LTLALTAPPLLCHPLGTCLDTILNQSINITGSFFYNQRTPCQKQNEISIKVQINPEGQLVNFGRSALCPAMSPEPKALTKSKTRIPSKQYPNQVLTMEAHLAPCSCA